MNGNADFVSSLTRLDQFLEAHQELWRPQPFKERRPAWCAQLPELCNTLLGLSENELTLCSQNDSALLELLQPYVPALSILREWPQISDLEHFPIADPGPHFAWEIPGRKWEQITAFASSVGAITQPLLEWCGGKGHLGRLLAQQWQVLVTTIDRDAALCHEGGSLAQRAHVGQEFLVADVLAGVQTAVIANKHVIALHACGELHRTLLRQAVAVRAPALDVAPCCYYFGAAEHYQPFSEGLRLQLRRDDLRLAVTETVTSSRREVQWRDQEMAWKLGYDRLRRDQTGDDRYHAIAPLDKSWLRLSFAEFCVQLARRDQWQLDASQDLVRYETIGWQRQREVMRLNLLRQSFRRALEIWIVLDITNFLVKHDYTVRLGRFCQREITPRNLLISARLS